MSYITGRFDDKIIDLLKNGAVGLLPSDTIYGLSGSALDRMAVEKIHRLKGRDSTKPFIVLVADVKMLDLLSISQNQARFAKKYWPGALSVVLAAPDTPAWLQLNTNTLAVRIPDRPALLELIKQVGPIVSTSANLEGQQPVHAVAEAQAIFSDQLDFYVDIGELAGSSSTLAIVRDGQLQVVRQGAVKINEKESEKEYEV